MHIMSVTDQWVNQPNWWRPVFWANCNIPSTDRRIAAPLGTCGGWRWAATGLEFRNTGTADEQYMRFVASELLTLQVPHALGLLEARDIFATSLLPVVQFAVMLPNQAAYDAHLPGLHKRWDQVAFSFQQVLKRGGGL